MARYLARIANKAGYDPRDARHIAKTIRDMFGAREAIGNLRVSSQAVEFDLFAKDAGELEARKSALDSRIGNIVTLKPLDQPPPPPRGKLEVLGEGIRLFNQERFWECHEVLEQIWHPSKGIEREIIQGLILAAAALVHAQKDENDISIRMLNKAMAKLGIQETYSGINLGQVRMNIGRMLKSERPEAFEIKL